MALSKTRLDVALVDRGLAASRERARALIMAGRVSVDGQIISKAGANVTATARVETASMPPVCNRSAAARNIRSAAEAG